MDDHTLWPNLLNTLPLTVFLTWLSSFTECYTVVVGRPLKLSESISNGQNFMSHKFSKKNYWGGTMKLRVKVTSILIAMIATFSFTCWVCFY